jgi:serine/threonine protein kinase
MQVGEILRDKYELVASIGRGGMGEVFHAVHLASGSNVAIKVVNRVVIGEMMMARFEREAEAVARIQSDFIPRLLEVDRTEGGELFLVMELLHGESLSERLKKSGGYLTWEEVRVIADDVLCGLMDAHAAGVIHRDLKPGNIFLEYLPDGSSRARILDFGVCKLDAGDAERLTTTGESVGTIAYMAPEQIRGASQVDERADLYSFAMVVFEALAGRLAYDASGQMALLASKLERPARNLNSVVRVPIPAALDALIARCLARTPQERFANAMDVVKAWGALGPPTQQPSSLPIISSGSIAIPSRSELSAIETSTTPSQKTSRGILVVAAGTVLVGTALIFAGLLARHARAGGAPTDDEAELQKALESSSALVPEAPASKDPPSITAAEEPAKLGPVVLPAAPAPVASAPPAVEVAPAPVPSPPPAVHVTTKPIAAKTVRPSADRAPSKRTPPAPPPVEEHRPPPPRPPPTQPASTPTLIETPKY